MTEVIVKEPVTLKVLRAKHNYTQAQAGAKVGVSGDVCGITGKKAKRFLIFHNYNVLKKNMM